MAKPLQVKQTIKSYFDNKGYSYDIEEKSTWVLYSRFKTRFEDKLAGLAIVYHGTDINVTVTFSELVQKKDYLVISTFMLRLNRYLKRGHFFLDYEAGSINFKMWHSSKGKVTVGDIDNLVLISIGSMETLMSVLQQVLKQEITVKEGVKLYVSGGEDS